MKRLAWMVGVVQPGTIAALALATASHAAIDPEQLCRKERYVASAKYLSCQQKALGRLYGSAPTPTGDLFDEYLTASGKCQIKYSATWPKLRAKVTGTGATCDQERFQPDGNGDISDHLSGLFWDYQGPSFRWSDTADGDFTDADGEVFTTAVAQANYPGPFGCSYGHCDWRLPTLTELQTLLLAPYPCSIVPACIESPWSAYLTQHDFWTSTTNVTYLVGAWVVNVGNGFLKTEDKHRSFAVAVVRGGL